MSRIGIQPEPAIIPPLPPKKSTPIDVELRLFLVAAYSPVGVKAQQLKHVHPDLYHGMYFVCEIHHSSTSATAATKGTNGSINSQNKNDVNERTRQRRRVTQRVAHHRHS